MEQIGERLVWYFIPFTDIPIPMNGINVMTIFNTLLVIAALWGLLWLGVRKQALIPGRGQMTVELIAGAFEGLVESSLEMPTRQENRKFFPLVTCLFVYLALANCMGFFPTNALDAPTGDINTTLSLGIMGMVIATVCGLRSKGVKGYVEDLLGPMWSQPGAGIGAQIAGKLSSIIFFPLNIIGEMSKVVSISFRLFGNMIGGSIIIIVVSQLLFNIIMPIPLTGFFVFFQGIIHAFVFTMLTLTYIAVAIK